MMAPVNESMTNDPAEAPTTDRRLPLLLAMAMFVLVVDISLMMVLG